MPLYRTPAYDLLPEGRPLTAYEIVPLDARRRAADPARHPPGRADTQLLFEGARVTPRTYDFELTRSLVARGFGYAVLIQRPAVDHTYEGLPVVVREITPASPSGGARMIRPRGVRLSDRAAAMVTSPPNTPTTSTGGFVAEHSACPERDPATDSGSRLVVTGAALPMFVPVPAACPGGVAGHA